MNRLSASFCEIDVGNGLRALVDAEDYERLNQFHWIAKRARQKTENWYVHRRMYVPVRRMKQIALHREILGLTARVPMVDHIDGDGLNNRRQNLRVATSSQNNASRLTWRPGQFRGVYWRKGRTPWVASINAAGWCRHLGQFDTAEAAALAYDAAALAAYGEFARLNFPKAA